MDQEELQRRLHPESEREKRQKAFWQKYGLGIQIGSVVIIILLLMLIWAVSRTPTKEEAAQLPTACFKHDVCIELIVLTTPEEQEIGLSNYTELPEGKGMLFIFDEPGQQSMWMKDMDFPIDMFWLSEKGKILHIEKKALPCVPPQCDILEPMVRAKYVLETDAGFAHDTNLFDGDKVTFTNIPR